MSATTATPTQDGQQQQEDGGGDGSSGGGEETFRQIPINTLMDHNDDIRRVCDDFTRALRSVDGLLMIGAAVGVHRRAVGVAWE